MDIDIEIKKFEQYIKDSSEDEKGMAHMHLEKISKNASEIIEHLDKMGDDIPAWVQDKLSVSNHNMQAINDWILANEYESISEKKENKPTNKKLWDKALRLAKGTKHGGSSYVTHDGERYDAPNDGKGYEEFPSAYSNSYAAKMYKKWGGKWETVNEDLRDWHKEKWVKIDTQGNIDGECGTMKDKDNPSRCLPKKKAESLTKEERAKTARKKKRSDKKYVPNTDKAKVTNSK